ncbi:MAG: SUMF1/EgtB/PvdO family nonheme iron enzyme [Lewinellaceae bacterium]|nr:SUMF1/EgtB/PvdO family nonheme iron enzyme [Lewinellaceae bacterium]
MNSPFKFLDPFELADKDVFFGRDKEIDTLYRMVYQTNLALVYGYSGTGKTSLIQCGLAGRFDGPQWYPFFIRKGEDINVSLRRPLFAALKEDPQPDVPLVELVEDILDVFLSPVYLIFDQFEELFILGSFEEQERFARDIQELLSQDLSCKAIFIIREEYLGELYQLEKALPRLFDFKLRVEPMNKLRVQEVLRSSFAAFNIGLEAPAEARLEEIVENVSMKKSGIQLPYLQVYLDQLYREDYERTYGDKETGRAGDGESGGGPPSSPSLPLSSSPHPPLEFTRQEIQSFGTMAEVFPRFLEGQKGAITQKLKEKYPAAAIEEHTIRDVLDVFVTEEGTKRPIPFEREGEHFVLPERLLEKFPLANPLLSDCLKALEQSRILRVREGSYELAHDSLAALIDEQRTDEQRQLNEVKVRLAGSFLEWQRTGEFLSRKQLLSIEPFLERLQMEPHLEGFVRESYAFNDAIEEADRQKQQAELEKERRLRGEAETAKEQAEVAKQQAEHNAIQAKAAKEQAEASRQQAEENAEKAAANARQARRRTRIAAVISLLAILLAVFAGVSWVRTSQAEAKAAKSASEATKEKERAEGLRLEAEDAKLVAQDSAGAALAARDRADSLYEIASNETERANLALANALASLLREAENHIRTLNYDAALKAILDAAGLGVKPREVAPALMEMAYHRVESHRFEEGRRLAQKTARLYGKAWNINIRQSAAKDSLRILRNALQGLAPGRFEELEKRYYPTMVPIKGGQFKMGCDSTVDVNCQSDETLHPTEVGDFEIAATETTLWQFSIYCEAEGIDINEFIYAGWGIDGARPVVYVSWYETLPYANWLSGQQGKEEIYKLEIPEKPNDLGDREGEIDWQDPDSINWNADGYRLPTEAEWEYAAKGGRPEQKYIYSGSDTLDLVGWYSSNSNSRTQPVEEKRRNSLGLYDMSGNVWEWCWDWYNNYPDSLIIDYIGPKEHNPEIGRLRVLRGGSWSLNASYARCSFRGNRSPISDYSSYGFRLARAVSF